LDKERSGNCGFIETLQLLSGTAFVFIIHYVIAGSTLWTMHRFEKTDYIQTTYNQGWANFRPLSLLCEFL
jgi:hypothetical protein